MLEEGRDLLLLSHFDKGTDASIQRLLASLLIREYGRDRVRHLPLQVCGARSRSVERSTRARSFLFIALALVAASAFGDGVPVSIPENGFVGVNIPLTGSRVGSYSTRTTHPSYLAAVRDALLAASIPHPIVNPYAALSKGQLVRGCRNGPLLRRLLPLTISCAKAGALRWAGYSSRSNCGRCYPCLMRRAALHTMGADAPGDYAYDAIGADDILYSPQLGMDLRSLLQAAHRLRGAAASPFLEMLKTGSLSSLQSPRDPLAAVEAGLHEFAALIEDKGSCAIRTYASL